MFNLNLKPVLLGPWTHFSVYVCVCVCTSHTNKQFVDTSRVSQNSTQFRHYLPGGGINTTGRPYNSDDSHKPRLLPIFLTYWL